MGGDEAGNHLMFFPGLMQQMRQCSSVSHAYSSMPAPGFPPQVHLPMMPGAYPPPPAPGPGAYTCARPGYAYAQAHAFAYPPPPPPPPGPGPYAYPPQGYPHPGLPAAPPPHLIGYGSSGGHGGAGKMEATTESKPKATGGTLAATASATAACGGTSHGSSGGHGGRRQVEVMETAAKPGSAVATASATSSAYEAMNSLFRGHDRSGSFGFFGNCCGGHNHRTSSFKHADGHGGHRGKFKSGHRPGKVEHVHGKFRAKRTTWKY